MRTKWICAGKGDCMENTVKRSHVRAVARAGPVLRALTGVALALLGCAVLEGCDKGIDPKPTPKYLLYATMNGYPTGSIAVIDCETDSVINYVKNMSGNPGVVASPDGRYFAALASGAPSQIFDAATRMPVGLLATPGLPLFLPDAGLLLCPREESTLVYDIPGFTLRESWPRPRDAAERVPGQQQVAAVDWRSWGHGEDLSKLVFFDYVNYRAVDSLIIEPDSQGIGFQIIHFTFSPDGTRLYALGGQTGFGAGLVGYDLRTRQVLFRQQMYGPYGSCQATPDGREVWATDPGYPIEDSPGLPQTIFIFDAYTGILIDTVSTRGISPEPYWPIAAREIRIPPDGSKAYVSCGDFFTGPQPILVISTATRHIERLIFGDFETAAWWIDIAPRP